MCGNENSTDRASRSRRCPIGTNKCGNGVATDRANCSRAGRRAIRSTRPVGRASSRPASRACSSPDPGSGSCSCSGRRASPGMVFNARVINLRVYNAGHNVLRQQAALHFGPPVGKPEEEAVPPPPTNSSVGVGVGVAADANFLCCGAYLAGRKNDEWWMMKQILETNGDHLNGFYLNSKWINPFASPQRLSQQWDRRKIWIYWKHALTWLSNRWRDIIIHNFYLPWKKHSDSFPFRNF